VTIADHLCEIGRFGQRSGKGWYRYEEGSRAPVRDDEVENMIRKYRDDLSIQAQAFSTDDIQQRLMAAMINEGALIVEEGVAAGNSDVDVVKLHGYGFPRWRGGPMHYGEQEGFSVFGEILSRMIEESPNSWKASRLLAGG
jgi:3-hydroxyacyl-CoA dehydrogenase